MKLQPLVSRYFYQGNSSAVPLVATCFPICLWWTIPPSGVAASPPPPHLHGDDEAGQVVGCLPGIADGGEVVEVGGALVPVHHHHVHVLLLEQKMHKVVDPDRGRSSGPVAVDDEGGGPRDVEERLGRRLVVLQLTAAVRVGAGVEQQPHVQLSSHEAVRQVEVSEVVAGLAGPALPLAYTTTTTTISVTESQTPSQSTNISLLMVALDQALGNYGLRTISGPVSFLIRATGFTEIVLTVSQS